jgi:hypothetical protein
MLQLPTLVIYRGNAVTAREPGPATAGARAPIRIRHQPLPYVRQRPRRAVGLAGWLWSSRGFGRPCPASPRRRRPRPRRGCSCSYRRRPRVPVPGGCIARRGGRQGEEPGAAGGSWCCGGAPRPASPGWPGTAPPPGCFAYLISSLQFPGFIRWETVPASQECGFF